MRDFRDAEAMASVLRDALEAETTMENRELIARAFGYENWNILSAKIEATAPRAAHEHTPAGTLFCAFCGKSQHEVRKLIAGPTSSGAGCTKPAACSLSCSGWQARLPAERRRAEHSKRLASFLPTPLVKLRRERNHV